MSASLSATGKEESASSSKTNALTRSGGFSSAPRVAWADVRVRALTIHDVDVMVGYFYRGLDAGANRQQIPSDQFSTETDYRGFLEGVVATPSRMPTVIIELRGRPIGAHWLMPAIDAHGEAEFQGTFWSVQDRGQGIGKVSWLKACEYFFAKFKFDTIKFRVPKDNVVAISLVKKLPLNFIGEEPVAGSVMRVYILTREEFATMNSKKEVEEDLGEDEDETDA